MGCERGKGVCLEVRVCEGQPDERGLIESFKNLRSCALRPARSARMTDSASRGADFLAKAEKKLKGFAIFGNKWEEGAELLEKAANCFKLAKMCACPCADVPGPWATAPHSSVVRTRRVQPHAGWSGCAAAALCARVGTVCTPVARACVAVRCAGARRCLAREPFTQACTLRAPGLSHAVRRGAAGTSRQEFLRIQWMKLRVGWLYRR